MALLAFLAILAALLPGATESRPVRESSQDAAFELDINNFNESLWAAAASFAVVELYAHWCPACRHYKPHYERVAKLFNGPNAPHPGVVYMAKVDCANQINSQLCWRFSVDHYPSLYWGPPGKLAWGSYKAKQDSGIELIQNTPRTSELLLDWINKRMGKNYALTDETLEKLESHESSLLQPMVSLHDIVEATILSYEHILHQKMLNAHTRASFLKFVQLLAVHHPSKRCRQGSADILVSFEDVWLSGDFGPNIDLLERIPICRDRPKAGFWEACRGSVNGTRGYSCGLWLLFHSLSVRVDDGESKSAMRTIRDFVASFFNCEECREHFLKMTASAVDMVDTRSDLVLWLWRAHNEVNVRVGKEEALSRTGDPQFLKQEWPPKQFCKACTLASNGWNESAVYSLLLEHYGRALSWEAETLRPPDSKEAAKEVVVIEDIASSRVSVPIGAAVGIAMASCGFGLVACYWRMQQKRRKLLRRRV